MSTSKRISEIEIWEGIVDEGWCPENRRLNKCTEYSETKFQSLWCEGFNIWYDYSYQREAKRTTAHIIVDDWRRYSTVAEVLDIIDRRP